MRLSAIPLALAAAALAGWVVTAPTADGSSAGALDTTPTADVLVGTCKNLVTAEEVVALSDVSPTVPCTTPHTLEAYAVVDLPADLAVRDERPSVEQLQVRTDVCPVDGVRPYLGAGDLDHQWGVSVFTKYPTRREWADGLRRAVCHLAVDHPAGTVPSHVGSLNQAMRLRRSAEVRLCRTDRGLVAYGDAARRAATYVTCDQPHVGEFVGDVDTALPLPGQRAACARRAEEYVGGPLHAPWSAYVATIDGGAPCWIGVDGPAVRGTLRAGLQDGRAAL